jgi:hypothetical protein
MPRLSKCAALPAAGGACALLICGLTPVSYWLNRAARRLIPTMENQVCSEGSDAQDLPTKFARS